MAPPSRTHTSHHKGPWPSFLHKNEVIPPTCPAMTLLQWAETDSEQGPSVCTYFCKHIYSVTLLLFFFFLEYTSY